MNWQLVVSVAVAVLGGGALGIYIKGLFDKPKTLAEADQLQAAANETTLRLMNQASAQLAAQTRQTQEENEKLRQTIAEREAAWAKERAELMADAAKERMRLQALIDLGKGEKQTLKDQMYALGLRLDLQRQQSQAQSEEFATQMATLRAHLDKLETPANGHKRNSKDPVLEENGEKHGDSQK